MVRFCFVLYHNAISLSLSLNREKIRSGLYGFNAIMIGLALGAIYPYSETLVVLIFALSLLVLMLTVAMEGFFKKYNLPFLAFPFWLVCGLFFCYHTNWMQELVQMFYCLLRLNILL